MMDRRQGGRDAIPRELAERCIMTARLVAERLCVAVMDGTAFASASNQMKDVYRSRPIPDWVAPGGIGFGMASGHLSIVPLFIAMHELDGDTRWLRVIEECTSEAHRAFVGQRFGLPKPGLFGGGLAGYLATADKLKQLGIGVGSSTEIVSLLETSLRTYPRPHRGMRSSAFDAFSGSAGVLYSALSVSPSPTSIIDLAWADLIAPLSDGGIEGLADTENFSAVYHHTGGRPRRILQFGAAHGLAGVLSTLARVSAQDARAAAQSQAVQVADYLVAGGTGLRSERLLWPVAVDVDRHEPIGPYHPGWCVGAAGVSSALSAAAESTGRDEYRVVAERALVDAIDMLLEDDSTQYGSDICHGLAGVLLAGMQVATPAFGNDYRRFRLDELADRTTERFDSGTRFGFRLRIGDTSVDEPGFLSGAAGTALTLLAFSTNIDLWFTRLLMM